MFPFLSNPSLSHLRTLYYESLTALTLLENIPGRLALLLQPVMNRMNQLNSIGQFGEQECVCRMDIIFLLLLLLMMIMSLIMM